MRAAPGLQSAQQDISANQGTAPTKLKSKSFTLRRCEAQRGGTTDISDNAVSDRPWSNVSQQGLCRGRWSTHESGVTYVLRLSGTLPPLSASFIITCSCSQTFFCSQTFISAESRAYRMCGLENRRRAAPEDARFDLLV
jgi:hypothetical protein